MMPSPAKTTTSLSACNKSAIKLSYVCFGNHSGYSQAAQDTILALHRSGQYDIRLQFVLKTKLRKVGLSDERYKFFCSLMEKPSSKDRITIYHCIPPIQRRIPASDGGSVGFAVFETYQPPNSGSANANWVSILNTNNAVVVPSEFNYKTFANERLRTPIYRIPHCYDTSLFNAGQKALKKYDKFTFLFFGSWRERKGYKQLIEAWCREFDSKDPVQLVIKTDKTATAKKTVAHIMQKLGFQQEETAPILFEDNIFDELELSQFLKSVDCLVSPTYGEGFGLPGLQCMALGVPIIITDFSGCQEYANENTATLLKPHGFVSYPMLDNLPQFRNKKWALVLVQSIQDAMRRVLDSPIEIREKAEYAQQFVSEKFTYGQVEPLFSEMLRTVFNV